MKTLLILLILAAACTFPANAQTSAPDSLMEALQGEDLEFFDPDLFVFPTARRDSIFAAWDSVGYKDMRDAQDAATRVFRWNLSRAENLGSFNRTEGFVGGLALELQPIGRNGPRISGELGRASG
ncbi:MAG: hypothetical protein HKN21_03150, partial [Candidatus Eisenbacteria bacterium]|nr:hypothetical protein [Candidatus Eisenbacteria bacterium]